MSNIEATIGEMKDLMKQLVDASKSQPTPQQLSQELWNSVQPILAAQRDLAKINHNSHMELIRVMVDGVKDSMKNFGKPTPRNQPKQKPEPAKDFFAKSSGKSEVRKKKGVDETLHIQTDEEITEKQKKKDTKKVKRKSFKHNKPPIATFPKPKPSPKKPTTATTKPKTNVGTKKPNTDTSKPKPSPQKPPHKKQNIDSSSPPPFSIATDVDAPKASSTVKTTAVETQVVSTIVSQTTDSTHFVSPPSTKPPTPQRFPSQSTFSPKPTSPSKTPPPPKSVYTRKRKFMVHEEETEIPTPIPISSTPFIPPSSPKTNPIKQPPTANIPQNIPLAVQYPLELLAV
ncbi:extensin-like [Helianthus annuus]|uniref:extensin-like n=1 Tax=Helianthus annuus TaxID=4232 RepID=UPI000B8FBED3|nr:extensin-like [Helianthus annuus]